MKLMKIGNVAKRLGIDQKTIRFYERKGLLKPYRNRNNYRLYSQNEVNALHFILSARAYRLSIKEIRLLLEIKRRKGDICADVTEMFKEKLKIITDEINALRQIRRKIKARIKAGIKPPCCSRKICDILQGGRLWKKRS